MRRKEARSNKQGQTNKAMEHHGGKGSRNRGITRKSRVFSRVITPVNAHITHILRVNWREVEFAAIYTSKVLTIDTREIAREHARTRVKGRAAFTRTFAPGIM